MARKYPVVAIYRLGRDGTPIGELRSGRLGTGAVIFQYTDNPGAGGSPEGRIAAALGTAARKLGVRIAGADRRYPLRGDGGNTGRPE